MPSTSKTVSAEELRRRFPDMYSAELPPGDSRSQYASTGTITGTTLSRTPSHQPLADDVTDQRTTDQSQIAQPCNDVAMDIDALLEDGIILPIHDVHAAAAEHDRRDESTGWPLLMEMIDTSYLTADQRNTARSNLRRVRRLAEDHGIASAKMLPTRKDIEG